MELERAEPGPPVPRWAVISKTPIRVPVGITMPDEWGDYTRLATARAA